MGDRVYMRITCRREDAPHFEKLGFVEDETESDTAISMVDEEANYGHWQPLQEPAKAGIPFFGWHDPGGEYDRCVGVGRNGVCRRVVHDARVPAARAH